MGKNRKRLKGPGAAQAPGPRPQHGMRPTAPPQPRPPPLFGGFRGPAPIRPMGPGQRFPAPHRAFGPRPPRLMRFMDSMDGDRGLMHEPQGSMMDDEPYHSKDIPDRHDIPSLFDAPDPHFHPHQEFGNGPPAPRFHRPEPEYGPRFHSPEFDDKPQMDVRGNRMFGDRGGFARPPPPDFRGPGQVQPPTQAFNATSMAPPVKDCPPQPLKKKDQIDKSMAAKMSTFKNISANAPRGRSLGVISFIGNNCGFIEREDLKKFSFTFDAFFGNRAQLVPGVKVHFTAVKNLGKDCAVDMKVAPGGTEDIDSTLYEGVVISTLPDDNVKEANPGCIRTFISTNQIEVPFGKADTSVTLLLYDLVEFQLLTNVITKEQRATNIKPKTPDTFDLTKEIRKMGVVMKKSDGTLTIMTEKHDNLEASATDKLSDDELNVMDKVELTVLTVNDTKKAVRLKKLPEGSVNFNQKAKGNENISGAKDRTSGTTPGKDKWKPVTMKAGSQDSVSFDASSEKYEGMIIKIVPKKSPSKEKVMDNQEPSLGFLVTTVEGTEKQLSFRSGSVITKATMMVGDKVQFNIFTNSVTKEEYADNIEILPETFQTDSEEQRKLGLVVKLGDNFGYIKTPQDPQIFFDISEVMEDTKLTLSEKVEFTFVPSQAAEGGKQAVRIRRLNESVFTSAPKLEAFGVKEKKKMTIKLLNHPKDQIKDVVETEDNGSESMDVEYNRYRSQSQDRSRSYYRSSSHERSDDQYRYSCGWSEEHEERYSQSHSRSPVEEELLRKRRELMELNELIARKKAIVAMEQNAKEIEPEDGKSVTTFDYQHVHHENIWMPDLKPVKSILKKQSEPHTDSQSQASTSRENAAFFVESQKMQIGYPQQTGDFGSDYSTFESTAKRTLTTAGSEKTSLTEIQDPELVRKRKQLEDLSEFIVRKKAMFAMEQKVKAVREMEAECEFDSHTENQFVMSKGNSWSSEIKPDFQPKKSILKRHSEIPTSQIDTTSVDEYGQPHQDDSFTKPSSKTAAFPFINRSSNPEPIHPVTLGLFNRIMNESSAASQMTETPPFNKPIIPQSLMQASSSRSLHDQKSSNISQEDQQGASSCLPHDHSPSSKPSTSQTSPSDPKRNLTTQMERFLSALNKADTSVVNSLFQEARKDLALMNTEKPTQPQLDRNTPFRDELYDPFKEDEDNDRPMVSENWSESSEDKVRKSENFEKIQSLLQTIGLQLDTAEVSKLADRTQERLYGKMRKPHSASSHSFEKKRERLGSQTEQRGSSRAHSSDSESFRSVSPAQSSSRKVYMSYEDAVKYKDQHKVEDVDLTSIKRTVVNLKPATDDKDPDEPELTAVSQASYQPVTTGTTVQPNYYQYAQNYSVSAFSASQYSQYQSSGQHVWGSMVPGLYPYSTVPSSPYAIGHQAMAPHMMPAYSWYTAQMANPYCVLPPLSMPPPYVPPPTSNPLHSTMPSADTNQVASEIPPESITATTTTPLRCLTKIKMVQTGPVIITEDQIKRRQKERLERFNQKMKLKNEQQMEAQRSRGQNPNSAPGKSTPNEIKNVWIFGHSLVFWAEKRATSPEYGVQLGMHPDSVRIWWKGVQGMTWQQLIPSLLQRKDKWPEPDVLIIHLGGNDISTTDPEAFVETVKKDLSSLKTIFPKCLFVWSSILSRQSWRGTEDSKGMNIIRMAVNETICKMMKELGGFSLIHKNIRLDGGVYRPDGIHLSGKGIDVFNLNLQAFLERWERKTNKTETSDPSV